MLLKKWLLLAPFIYTVGANFNLQGFYDYMAAHGAAVEGGPNGVVVAAVRTSGQQVTIDPFDVAQSSGTAKHPQQAHVVFVGDLQAISDAGISANDAP